MAVGRVLYCWLYNYLSSPRAVSSAVAMVTPGSNSVASEDHAAQAKGILITRALVIITAMMLAEPERPVEAVVLLIGS